MPIVFSERIDDPRSSETASIELSPYQIQLNRIYQIASPMLYTVFSVHQGSDIAEMTQAARNVDEEMRQWQLTLPLELDLDRLHDLSIGAPLKQRLHSLQALSLRLTYLNLKIIIHRSLLTDRRQRDRIQTTISRRNSTIPEDTFRDAYDTSLNECVQAALAVSRLGQSKPNVILLAGKTHLLSFLAMNIFTSSVVLFICAMSDILSNTAQEAKRGLSRNLKLLKSMSEAGSLSSQCCVIVTDLVRLILDKEKDEMLLGPLNVANPDDVYSEMRLPIYDHLIAVPTQTNNHNEIMSENHAEHTLGADLSLGDSANVFGRTMGQLNKGLSLALSVLVRFILTLCTVLKDASHARFVESRTDLPAGNIGGNREPDYTGDSWQIPISQDHQHIMGFDQDITQAWLWNLDYYENETPGWDGYSM